MTDKSLGRFYALAQEFWSQISEGYLHAYLEALAQAEGVEVGVFLQRAQEEAARLLKGLSPS
ncbi:hypothetical protein [Thermus sp.]|uniref:hypothetical protein n=1 Tax=Thermus sp. TaxID=275 RepID=UPI003918EA4A